MSLEQRRVERSERRLDLPPPFHPIVLREVGDAFAHATNHAAELGAGTLVFVGRFDLAEFAVILEPEEPLATARAIFYAGMMALFDALAAAAPPEKPITIDWPDAIAIDRGLIGGGRLAWPKDADEQEAPEWLVFAAAIRTVSMRSDHPGLYPLATALDEEGFSDISAVQLTEAFARYLMVRLDAWNDGGLAPLAKDYVARLKPPRGETRELDAAGDLLIHRIGRASEKRKLSPALAMPSWLDPAAGGPRR